MELTNIREIFRSKEQYADKTVTIGGWVRSRSYMEMVFQTMMR